MKAYKIELLVIDFDEVGSQGIISEIENANYGNDCISPRVKSIVEKDIGEWSDGHPLNLRNSCDEAFRNLFDKK
jgi:hypothetical protein